MADDAEDGQVGTLEPYEAENDQPKTMATTLENYQPKQMKTLFELMYGEEEADITRRDDNFSQSIVSQLCVTFVIVLNAVVAGIEIDLVPEVPGGFPANQGRSIFMTIDVLFAWFFLTDFVGSSKRYVRNAEKRRSWVYGFGWDYFGDCWNAFEFVLVVAAWCALISHCRGQSSMGIKLVAALRLIRLLKVVRAIKGERRFRELWFIVQGMLDSLSTLMWVGVLLCIIVYCVAVVLTSSVGQSQYAEERWAYTQQYVGTVPRSMWTVLQVITFDAWATDIARPMEIASSGSVWLLIFTIIICSFGVLNVIVAVMVQHTRKMADDNIGHVEIILEQKDNALLDSLREEFRQADANNDRTLSRSEFADMLALKSFNFKLRLLGINIEEAHSLFDLLDTDNSGTVNYDEFSMGLKKIKGVAKGQDLVQLISYASRECLRANKFVERVHALNQKADMIQERLARMGKGMRHELTDRNKADKRKDEVWERAKQRQKVITELDRDRRIQFPQLA